MDNSGNDGRSVWLVYREYDAWTQTLVCAFTNPERAQMMVDRLNGKMSSLEDWQRNFRYTLTEVPRWNAELEISEVFEINDNIATWKEG